jgi:hypothetical protein
MEPVEQGKYCEEESYLSDEDRRDSDIRESAAKKRVSAQDKEQEYPEVALSRAVYGSFGANPVHPSSPLLLPPFVVIAAARQSLRDLHRPDSDMPDIRKVIHDRTRFDI